MDFIQRFKNWTSHWTGKKRFKSLMFSWGCTMVEPGFHIYIYSVYMYNMQEKNWYT